LAIGVSPPLGWRQISSGVPSNDIRIEVPRIVTGKQSKGNATKKGFHQTRERGRLRYRLLAPQSNIREFVMGSIRQNRFAHTVLALLLAFCLLPTAPAVQKSEEKTAMAAADFPKFVEDYLNDLHSRHPSQAAASGIHAWDGNSAIVSV
jgi:hypothetical protein